MELNIIVQYTAKYCDKPTTFIGEIVTHYISHFEYKGVYIDPKYIELDGHWYIFKYINNPYKYFRYPHLLIKSMKDYISGKIVSGYENSIIKINIIPDTEGILTVTQYPEDVII